MNKTCGASSEESDIEASLAKLREIPTSHISTTSYAGVSLVGTAREDDSIKRIISFGARVVPHLIRLLDDPIPYVREKAVIALGRIGDPSAIEPLIQAAAKNDDWFYSVFEDAITQFSDSSAVPELIKLLEKTCSESIAQALVRFGDARAIPALVECMRCPTFDVSHICTFGQVALPFLIGALQDTNPIVRANAAQALRELKDPRAVEALNIAIADPDSNVRCIAIYALQDIGDPRAIPALISRLTDNNDYVKAMAAQALGVLRAVESIPHLSKLLDHQDVIVASNARDAITRIPKKRWMFWT